MNPDNCLVGTVVHRQWNRSQQLSSYSIKRNKLNSFSLNFYNANVPHTTTAFTATANTTTNTNTTTTTTTTTITTITTTTTHHHHHHHHHHPRNVFSLNSFSLKKYMK